jgi:hypothetical protein
MAFEKECFVKTENTSKLLTPMEVENKPAFFRVVF